MSSSNSLVILVLILKVISLNTQQVKYLNLWTENEACELERNIYGTCRKISDCPDEFETFRRRKSVLKVCKYERIPANNLICCPKNAVNSLNMIRRKSVNITSKSPQLPDLLDFNTCRRELLKYRDSTINPDRFVSAILNGVIPNTTRNHQIQMELNRISNFEILKPLRPTPAAYYAKLAKRGSRPNMAAIGWTQNDNKIVYNCGGSLITERFIITAAHCRFFASKEADTVRLGDRFLITEQDDEIAQQHRIERFIIHPNYSSNFNYNDIALIKTATIIFFNKYVVPACIYDLNIQEVGKFSDWSVAGYGQTEDGVKSNILLELEAHFIPYEECNRTYEYHPPLPNGILSSQFCVRSDVAGRNYPDTCFGDSGSPLQVNLVNEIFHNDFDETFLTTAFQTPTVLGIVSFGIDCGQNIPSVYTKVAYFKDWMRKIIRNNQ